VNKAVAKKCKVNLAEANLLLKNWETVIEICDDIMASLELGDILEILSTKRITSNCLRPLIMKGTSLIELERYEEAIGVLLKAKEIEDSKEVKKLLNNARMLLKIKQGSEQTHYEVLGVDKNVTEDELKTIWRKLAKENHPDRFANATEKEKAEKEEQMKTINLANDILSDPEKRKKYDAELSMKEMYAREAERESSKTRDSSQQPEERDPEKEFEEYLKSEWEKHWTEKMTKLKKPRPPSNAEKDEFINNFLRTNRDHIRDRYGFDIPPGSFGSHNKRQERRRKKRK
jgi:DnaJ-domain-containing protein 1